MAVLGMEGLSVEVKMETMPDKIDIKFCLASLEIEDHRVRDAVKLKNPGLTDDIPISEKVLETWKKPLQQSINLLTVSVNIFEEEQKQTTLVADDKNLL